MNYNEDLLLECVNYYHKSDFTDARMSKVMSDGLLLVDVTREIDYISWNKTVIIEKEEYSSFLRMKKLEQLGID